MWAYSVRKWKLSWNVNFINVFTKMWAPDETEAACSAYRNEWRYGEMGMEKDSNCCASIILQQFNCNRFRAKPNSFPAEHLIDKIPTKHSNHVALKDYRAQRKLKKIRQSLVKNSWIVYSLFHKWGFSYEYFPVWKDGIVYNNMMSITAAILIELESYMGAHLIIMLR